MLKDFAEEYRVGRTKGAGLRFDPDDKARIREILLGEGSTPDTLPAAWDGISRAAALNLGPNE